MELTRIFFLSQLRLDAAESDSEHGERRHFGILLNHTYYATVQAHAAFVRLEDSHTDIQGISERVDAAGVLLSSRYRNIRESGLLCGADTNKSA